MRLLSVVLALVLSACQGSGEVPVPLQGTWAKFAGGIADDAQGSSVSSCAVNVLTLENNVFTSYYHEPKAECDCSIVQPGQAAQCIGGKLNSDDSYVVKAIASNLLFRVMNISSLCPAIQGISGIPFVPPDCLAGSSPFNSFSSTPVVKLPEFVVGADPASKELDINTAVISSFKSYVTREGDQAHSVLYKSLEKSYEGCELDVQVVFGIDASGNLVPARQASALIDAENFPELNVVPLEYHLSSELSQKCMAKVGSSDNANSTDIDNVLNPYTDLHVEFGPLQDGVLALDYTERFYKVQ